MKASSPPKPAWRKYALLFGALLAVFAGWSGFWMVSHSKTQGLVDKLMARQVNGTPILTCSNQTLGGYPFRLLLTCSNYQINNPANGWQITGGPLRAVWQVYAPNLAVIEAETELKAIHPASGQSFGITSELIRASVRLTTEAKIARASMEAKNPSIASNNPALAAILGDMKAKLVSFHARPNPNEPNDLDFAISGTELETGPWPRITGSLGFTALGGATPALIRQPDPFRAWLTQSGQITAIAGNLQIGQKTLKLSGDFAINQQGKSNGDLVLKILNPKPEDSTIKPKLTAKQDGLNGPLTALQLMGKPISEDNLVGSRLPITIRNSSIQAGFLPLGKVPPIR